MTTTAGTLDYDSGTGLYDKLGPWLQLLKVQRAHMSTLVTEYEDAIGSHPHDQITWGAAAIGRLDQRLAEQQAVIADIRETVGRILVEEMHLFDPLIARTVPAALLRLRQAMIDDGETVENRSVTATAAAVGSPNGDGVWVVGGEPAWEDYASGQAWDVARVEDVELLCTRDAQLLPATAVGSETFVLSGQAAEPRDSRLFPGGSGVVREITSTSSTRDGSPSSAVGENILANAGFEAFTAGAPNQWLIDTGTLGDTVNESATAHRGSKSLKFERTAGAELTRIRQQVDNTAGTRGKLRPESLYVLGAWMRDGATPPTAGVMRLSLRDTTSAAGAQVGSAALTVDHSSLSSTWQFFHTFLTTPRELHPDGVETVLELTTSVGANEQWLVDNAVCAQPHRIAPPAIVGAGDLSVLGLPGANPWIVGDRWRISKVAGAATGEFNHLLDVLFDLWGLGLVLPSDATPSISDALIA